MWIRNLFIALAVCAVVLIAVLGVFLFDVLNGDIGFVRY